jgi:RND family efflux transporter MFP subunit
MEAARARRALALVVVSLAGCHRGKATAVVAPPVVVTVATPIPKKVTNYVHGTGNTQALQSVEVTPRVQGFIDQIQFKDGQRVKGPHKSETGADVPGDPLFVIDPRPFVAAADKARADLAVATATEKQSEFRLGRLEEALKGNAIAELDVIQQRALVDQQKAQVDSARATLAAADLQVDLAHIRAPIDGRISRTRVTVGNLVGTSSESLCTIIQDNPLAVYFSISERDLLDIRASQRLHPRPAATGEKLLPKVTPIEVSLANETGYPHTGRVDYADPFVDPKTGTITVRGILPNDDESLLPGLFVRVRVPMGEPQDALLVSERAISTDQGQKYVLIADEKNTVEYRPVKVGAVSEGLRVVEGLKPTDRVIVNGLLRVRAGVVVDPKIEDMATLAVAPASTAPVSTEAGSEKAGKKK